MTHVASKNQSINISARYVELAEIMSRFQVRMAHRLELRTEASTEHTSPVCTKSSTGEQGESQTQDSSPTSRRKSAKYDRMPPKTDEDMYPLSGQTLRIEEEAWSNTRDEGLIEIVPDFREQHLHVENGKIPPKACVD